ncbi:DUF2254 domain-containing protein [Leeuwenhoekiella sp. W20_SRS_FM14]|uniref:DUF2254 domain-containing protein n=1 Tax=Leeuwenhoekiella sp. W20_SRS_FM14 TaxID=3240270 RepID=UPI003F9CDBB8
MLKVLKKILQSIALVPSVLALCFFVLAVLIISIDINYDEIALLKRLVFNDKEDVQFVLAFLIGGIFTLTIFSYTMVMNVLNRNINNYSPRLIPMILSEKHHQIILGFTSGTIIYAMTLSIALNAKNSPEFPGIAAPLGVFFGIISVLLFIYFIHSVSRSIHINYIVKEAYVESYNTIKDLKKYESKLQKTDEKFNSSVDLVSVEVGYLKMPDLSQVERILDKHQVSISLHKHPGAFIRKNEQLISLSKSVSPEVQQSIYKLFPIDHTVSMDAIETGFKHLVEIGVKAMSPAINDPGTAITIIDYITQLFIDRSQLKTFNFFKTENNNNFHFKIVEIELLRDYCYLELYRYIKEDPIVRAHLLNSLEIVNALEGLTRLQIHMLDAKL